MTTVSIIGENQQTPHAVKHGVIQRNNKTNEEPVPLNTHTGRVTPISIAMCEANVEIWQNMVYKEEAALKLRNAKVFSDRRKYLPRMRASLLNWIMEVCEFYHFRRSTYYLAVDYIDRSLTMKPELPKTQLQLLGVSCLYIAAKLEEIYPLKLSQYSYVCDGACTEQEIIACEALLLGDLSWDLNPMTPTSWLSLFMQIYSTAENNECRLDMSYDFQFPQYSGYNFVRASHLIDLFSMDPGFLRYSYSVIAAAALFYVFGRDTATSVSGFAWNQLESCIEYMNVFSKLVSELPDSRESSETPLNNNEGNAEVFRAMRVHVPNIIYDEKHCMQTHVIDLDCFEKATLMRLEEMGMRVEKTFAKRKKQIEEPSTHPPPPRTSQQSENTNDEEDGQQLEEETVVIYKIEKILNEAVEHNANILINDNKPTENGRVGINILKIDQKTELSFDDILSSIHNDYYGNKYNKC